MYPKLVFLECLCISGNPDDKTHDAIVEIWEKMVKMTFAIAIAIAIASLPIFRVTRLGEFSPTY
jgi:hypothetical protein